MALKGYTRQALPGLTHRCRESFSTIIKSKDYFLYILIVLFFSQVVLFLIKMYFLPPHVWDVFAYHLHPVAEWLQGNMIPASIDTPVVRLNRNPMGLKLLHFWIVKFLGDITWIEFPQFIYGIISVTASYAIMLKMSIKKTSAVKYAILIYFIPLIQIESRTCQDHLALTGALLTAMLFFINVFFEKNYLHILFLGLSFGLMLGIKISGPHIIIVFFLALLLSRGFKLSTVLEFFKKNILFIAVGGFAGLILGGYWYFKDILVLRSYYRTVQRLFALKPLLAGVMIIAALILCRWLFKKFPIAAFFKNKKVIIAGIVVFAIVSSVLIATHAGVIKTFVFGHTNPGPLLSDKKFLEQYPLIKATKTGFTKNVLLFPFRIKDIGMYIDYTPDFLDQSGFGVQFFGFGLLAYLMMAVLFFIKKYRRDIMGYMFIFSAALLGTYFIYYYTSANYRLFMFFPVIGIMLWAYLVEKWGLHRYIHRFFDVIIIVMVLFNIAVTFIEGNTDKNRWKTILTLDNPVERTSIKYSPLVKTGDWIYIDRYIPPWEPIGYTGHMDSWIFLYFDNRMERRVYHLKSLKGFQLVDTYDGKDRLEFNEDFIRSLKEREIHYIHINPHGARHLAKYFKPVFIENKDVFRVTESLYYYKW